MGAATYRAVYPAKYYPPGGPNDPKDPLLKWIPWIVLIILIGIITSCVLQ